MFEYIKGELVAIKDEYVVLENNGIGYKVFTSLNSMMELKVGEEVKMYIYYNLREDGVFLFGFLEEEELDMFNLLILVSKVGPKTAIGVLSTLTAFEIKEAILSDNVKLLCKAPGIGKKTGERIILELRDRVKKVNVSDSKGQSIALNDNFDVAIEALESLGYNSGEVRSLLQNFEIDGLSEEEIIKLFLKNTRNS